MVSNYCKYLKKCEVYQGEISTGEIPPTIYKNVFCHRGLKGWKNCKKYLDFKKQELIEKK